MNEKSETHHRRSLRLKGYDYAQPGAYFITIVTQNRLFLFGNIIDGEMHLNDAGKMIDTTWQEIPSFYPGVEIDAVVGVGVKVGVSVEVNVGVGVFP